MHTHDKKPPHPSSAIVEGEMIVLMPDTRQMAQGNPLRERVELLVSAESPGLRAGLEWMYRAVTNRNTPMSVGEAAETLDMLIKSGYHEHMA